MDHDAEVLYKELEYRRKKQWDIFSWCSTLLVGISGGVIALQIKDPKALHPSLKFSISSGVLVLVAYAVLWIGHNWNLEKSVREHCFSKSFIDRTWTHKRPQAGYRTAIFMLGGAALVATWIG